MIPTYTSFIEKSQNFKINKIDSLDDFESFIEEHKSDKRGIYRGIHEAEYKIYTSLQRERLLGNLSDSFSVAEYVEKFRENPLIKKYFEIININLSKISVLSFLQHHKAPTPLVDFTSNVEIALFFAIENLIDIRWNTSVNEIENYFSIFFIENEHTELLDIEKVIQGVEKMKDQLEGLIHDKIKYNTLMLNHIDQMTEIGTMEIFLVNLENRFRSFSTLNNIRILSQEGLFIHNSFKNEPLEVALKQFFIPATQFIGSELDDMEGIPDIKEQNDTYLQSLEKNRANQQKLEENIIVSYEINKSLIPEIAKEMSIDKNLIYPDFEKMCAAIFSEAK